MLVRIEEPKDTLAPCYLSDFVNEIHNLRNAPEGFVEIDVFKILDQVCWAIVSAAHVINANYSFEKRRPLMG